MRINYVKADSVDGYFAKPKSEREKNILFLKLYRKPYALPWEGFGNNGESGWEAWDKRIKKEYPIQWFFREWLPSYDNPIYAFFGRLKMKISDFRYGLKNWLFPPYSRTLKAARPFGWRDMDTRLVDINFALILDFYYEEYLDSHIDWEHESHRDFSTELKEMVHFIEIRIPEAKKEIQNIYSKIKTDTPKEERDAIWNKTDKIDQGIAEIEMAILTWLLKNKDKMWT